MIADAQARTSEKGFGMDFETLVEVTRGPLVESRHLGALAIVDPTGELLYSCGDPALVTYLRSSAKPMQSVALVESGAADAFGLSDRELAVISSSHNGEEMHTACVAGILQKIGLGPEHLACGLHAPLHLPAARHLLEAGQPFTVLHNNCSGKHAGMLALARHLGVSTEGYFRPEHPVQQRILSTVSAFTSMAPADIVVGVDGCGVPVFGMPLRNAAWAFARLADPRTVPPALAAAARRVVTAMQTYPEMVGGTQRFDTELMQQAAPRLFAKGGAEGYHALGILPFTGGRTDGLGMALKIADGDQVGRAMPVAVIEALRRLGVLTEADLTALAKWRTSEARNHRGEVVGQVRPALSLHVQGC
jgi:L-asparaginase II